MEGTRARTHEGTGIGLALVQELVRLHGGYVQVESTHGQGTTFTVTIPMGFSHLPAERIGSPGAAASAIVGANPYLMETLHWQPESGNGDSPLIEALDRLPATAEPTATAARPRILLADDNADMRSYVRRLLAGRYDVHAVADGEAALAAARADRPDPRGDWPT